MRPLMPILLVVFLLAGCAGGGGGKGSGTGDDEVPELEATDTTGVIRAVVVDDAIRPLAGVRVAVEGASTSVNKTTDNNGFAGFEDLEPGTYLLRAAKAGYGGLPQSVTVEAGINDPPVVKLLLSPIQGERPFYGEAVYEGYMQCAAGSSMAGANLCFIANYYPCLAFGLADQACPTNLTSDNSFFEVPFVQQAQRVPDLVQVELVWDSTQTVSESLLVRADIQGPEDTTIPYANESQGPSPIYVTLNRSIGEEYSLGINRSLFLEVFTAEGATSPMGVAVNQQIKYFVHAFYGYLPPPGWRFSDGNGVPPPPY